MGKTTHPLEQKAEAALQKAKEIRDEFGKSLTSQGGLSQSYGPLLSRLRELGRGDQNPKEFIRALSTADSGTRRAIAFRGPSDGIGKIVMKYLPQLGLSREDNLASALLCILEDAEQAYPNLPDANLPPEDQLLVVIGALQTHQVLEYEEFKTIEVLYQSANPDNPNEGKEAQRRFDQARGRRTQHVKKHLLKLVPGDFRKRPDFFKVILRVALKRDVFGSLDVLREDVSAFDLNILSTEEKLELLNIIADFGVGLASLNLDIFNISADKDPDLEYYLQNIFKDDVTRSLNLIGVYAFEGVHHYPFNFKKIEPTLPRRISSAEAHEYLKKGDTGSDEDHGSDPEKKARVYSSNEIADTVVMLQERETQKFLEFLKWEITRNWRTRVGDRKRDVVFADVGLKLRNLLFLITHSVFDEELVFENIFLFVQKCHPHLAEDMPKLLLLANRYYFLDILGLNPGMLYNRIPRGRDRFGTLIEEVGDYQIKKLLHIGVSIYIRAKDSIFRSMPIAWNMLLGQCDGKIDQAFHEVGQLYDAIDTLLIILEPVIHDMPRWAEKLLGALSENEQELPDATITGLPANPLRVTTRTIIAITLEILNNYCVKALQQRAASENVTALNIIQTLKIDRAKSDKLRTLLQAETARQKQGRRL